jgi:hypothetical protein
LGCGTRDWRIEVKVLTVFLATTLGTFLLPAPLSADELMTYRKGGQSAEQLRNRESLNGKLMLQGVGVESGLGWTFAVDAETGRSVVSAPGDEVAFIIFGACTPIPPT